MPLDPAIPLAIKPPTFDSPFDAQQKVMGLRSLALQQQNQAAELQTRQQQQQLNDFALADARRRNAGRDLLTNALTDPANRDDTGKLDSTKVYQHLLPSAPEVASDWLTMSKRNADVLQGFEDSKKAHAEKTLETTGSLAQSAKTRGEFDVALGQGAVAGILTKEEAQQYAAAADEQGDDGWQAFQAAAINLMPSRRASAAKASEALQQPQKLSAGEVFGVPGEPPAMTGGPRVAPTPSPEELAIQRERNRIAALRAGAAASTAAGNAADREAAAAERAQDRRYQNYLANGWKGQAEQMKAWQANTDNLIPGSPKATAPPNFVPQTRDEFDAANPPKGARRGGTQPTNPLQVADPADPTRVATFKTRADADRARQQLGLPAVP